MGIKTEFQMPQWRRQPSRATVAWSGLHVHHQQEQEKMKNQKSEAYCRRSKSLPSSLLLQNISAAAILLSAGDNYNDETLGLSSSSSSQLPLSSSSFPLMKECVAQDLPLCHDAPNPQDCFMHYARTTTTTKNYGKMKSKPQLVNMTTRKAIRTTTKAVTNRYKLPRCRPRARASAFAHHYHYNNRDNNGVLISAALLRVQEEYHECGEDGLLGLAFVH